MALNYYNLAKKASLSYQNHPGLVYLKHLCQNSRQILDVGCGEGTRLNTLLSSHQKGHGIDVSPLAIRKAIQQYPRHNFRCVSALSLPFKDNSYDLVYSAFALEHTTDPVSFLKEMVRVCTPHGAIVIVCPNFGSPNRRSPNSIQSPILKLLFGFLADLHPTSNLCWQAVTPKTKYNQIDDDTTVEPYLLSLSRWFKSHNCYLEKVSSLWVLEPWSINPRKFIFKLLGLLGIYPFKYWGPQLFITARKIPIVRPGLKSQISP